MRPLAFLDVETTGLDSAKHELLEVAVITRKNDVAVTDVQLHFSLPIDLDRANDRALEINRYHERRKELAFIEIAPSTARLSLEAALSGCVVIGNNVGFDLRFIKQFLRESGRADEPWYYAPLDLKALVAGRCGMSRPASTACIAEVAGVPIPAGAHTALEDCRWNRSVYDALTR